MYLRWVPCSFLPVVSYFIATSGVRLFPRAPLVFSLSTRLHTRKTKQIVAHARAPAACRPPQI